MTKALIVKVAVAIALIAFGANPGKTLGHVLPNCEDGSNRVPCYTFDEGHWRVVYSYNPYRFKNVK